MSAFLFFNLKLVGVKYLFLLYLISVGKHKTLRVRDSLCMMDVTQFHHNADPLTELSCIRGVGCGAAFVNDKPTTPFF